MKWADWLLLAVLGALLALLAALGQGCTPPRPTLPPSAPERAWIDAGAEEWRTEMVWDERCDRRLARLTVDRDVSKCEGSGICDGRPCGCTESGIHVHPQIEQLRGEGTYRRTVLHELGHVLVSCTWLDPYGDPGHKIQIWEQHGNDSWLRRTQRRVETAQ